MVCPVYIFFSNQAVVGMVGLAAGQEMAVGREGGS
jgi:hypothetical protein